jgi:hypothetical protein
LHVDAESKVSIFGTCRGRGPSLFFLCAVQHGPDDPPFSRTLK